MSKFTIGLAVLVFILLSMFETPPDGSSLETHLDCLNTYGLIKSYCEINCGPSPVYYIEGVELIEQYRDIGVDMVRTHDFFGPTDIHSIFPNWSADPFDENSYDFSESDEVIKSIIDAGCKIFYRLGESASDNKILRQPPENYSKWAEVCKHIVMHYNDGWNNGYHYNITYWEIWNEPDLKGFWNGTSEEYYQLYSITAQTLKNYNNSLKIGGSSVSSIDNLNYTRLFLEHLVENNVLIDFFSWHCYATTPEELRVNSLRVRSLLDSFGLTECEDILTEWNIHLLTPQRDKENARNAAFTANSIILFQDADLNYAFRYRGTQDNNWLLKLSGFDLSLFTDKGLYKTPALVYKALYYITQDTPIRLTPINETTIHPGINYLAGISKDKNNISILISNYDAVDTEYNINITNIPWNSSYTIAYYIIDDSHHLEIIDEEVSNGETFNVNKLIKRNTVHFIRLTNSSTLPEEGPPVAPIPFILRLPLFDPILYLVKILVLMIILG